MADDFHARFSAGPKSYEYRIWNAPTLPPFVRLYAWHIIEPLDFDAMCEGTRALVGEHDFAAFRGAGAVNHTTVRTIESARWKRDGSALTGTDVATARRWFTSFGSCSVTEPLDDLISLGLVDKR